MEVSVVKIAIKNGRVQQVGKIHGKSVDFVIVVYPYLQSFLDIRKSINREENSRPHEVSNCQMCIRLGYNCLSDN